MFSKTFVQNFQGHLIYKPYSQAFSENINDALTLAQNTNISCFANCHYKGKNALFHNDL